MFVRDVTRALEEANVPYCVVGGLAVNLHGIPRTTFDIDLVVPREAAPLRRCREALESLGRTSPTYGTSKRLLPRGSR